MDILKKHINDLTKEDWIDLYYNKGFSLTKLANDFGVNPTTIMNKMDKFGIKRKKAGRKKQCSITKDKLKEFYIDKGLSYKEIAKKFGCSDKTVKRWVRNFSLPRRKSPKDVFTKDFLQKNYVEAGKSITEIAKETGFAPPNIYRYLYKYGFSVKEGESVLDEEQKEKITKLYSNGKTTIDISNEIGVSFSVVNYFLNKQQKLRDSNYYKRKLPSAEEVIHLYWNDNKSTSEIAKIFGVNKQAVVQLLRRNGGLKTRSSAVFGNKNPMFDKKHSVATRNKMSKAYLLDIRNLPCGPRGNSEKVKTPYQGVIRMKSSWEAAVARFLSANEIKYLYEDHKLTFFDGERRVTYTPDFTIVGDPDLPRYIEVKGLWTEESLQKVKLAISNGYDISVWDAKKLQVLGILDNSFRTTI